MWIFFLRMQIFCFLCLFLVEVFCLAGFFGFVWLFKNIYLFFSIIITAVCNQAVTIRSMLSPKYLGLDWIDAFHMVWTVSSSSFGIGAMVFSPSAITSPHHYTSLRRWESLDHEVTKRKSKKETFSSLPNYATLEFTGCICMRQSASVVLSLAQTQNFGKVLEPKRIVNYYIEFKTKLVCFFKN